MQKMINALKEMDAKYKPDVGHSIEMPQFKNKF